MKRNYAKKVILLFSIFLMVAAAIGLGYKFLTLEKLKNWEKSILDNLIKKIDKEILTPQPLIEEKFNPNSYLTKEGVIYWTNIQRQKYNLKTLSENQLLKKAAEKKIEDMFTQQYFDHVSPQGLSPSYFVESVGYQYIIIGENLAMGDFKNDQALVEAWMNSPGHRENILNPKFTEIGVAVKKDWIQGRYTWLAVQVFAKPLSSCPQVDKNLENKINYLKNQLQQLENEIALLKKEIENLTFESLASYKEKIYKYNLLVDQYNNTLAELKKLVEQYNKQVEAFNLCIQK